MNKITNAFKNGKVFIPFVTAGDPSIADTENFIIALDKAGAGVIEIGIPFSDPIADGDVIQCANIRALAGNVTTQDVFDMCKRLKGKISAPLVFLTYLNPVFVFGYDKFFALCAECGVDGVIIPDSPIEESEEYTTVADKYGITSITLVAPTSTNRIKLLTQNAKGFIYLVSSMGITGVRKEIQSDLKARTDEIAKYTSTPVAVGFGIATSEQANTVAHVADGVIVGSAVVKIIAEFGANASEPLYDYAKEMIKAIKA